MMRTIRKAWHALTDTLSSPLFIEVAQNDVREPLLATVPVYDSTVVPLEPAAYVNGNYQSERGNRSVNKLN